MLNYHYLGHPENWTQEMRDDWMPFVDAIKIFIQDELEKSFEGEGSGQPIGLLNDVHVQEWKSPKSPCKKVNRNL